MTNNWTDIANATLVVAWGANPTENHPACIAHVNRARRGPYTMESINPVTSGKYQSNKPAAKLIVVDPRKTRTALQADKYIRIRPGTDIALQNGIIRYITRNIADGTDADKKYRTHFEQYMNQGGDQSFIPDGSYTAVPAKFRSKYTDARFKLNSTGGDYQRYNKTYETSKTAFKASVVYDTVTTGASQRYKMWYLKAGETYIQYATSADGVTWTSGAATDVLASQDSPSVFMNGSTFYMVNNDGGVNLNVRSSSNCTTWTSGTQILDGNAGLTDGGSTPITLAKYDAPNVLKDGATWRLYFQGKNADSSVYRIYSAATSGAPGTWASGSFAINGGANPLPALEPSSPSGNWDSLRVMHPSVVKDGSTYVMAYSGYNSTEGSAGQKISTAVSADGLTFSRPTANTYLKGLAGAGSVGIGKPCLIPVAGDSFMLFHHDEIAWKLRQGHGKFCIAGSSAPFTGLPASGDYQFMALPVQNASTTSGMYDTESVYQKLYDHVAPYTTSVVKDICGLDDEGDIAYLANALIENSRHASYTSAADTSRVNTPYSASYRATTILYAMGITQHTCGSQNIKGFANLQTLLGNMGRAGGGINALRGIHNVQGSTDMGVLYSEIPAYSKNPTEMTAGYTLDSTLNNANAFGKYMDGLWGNRMNMYPSGGSAYDDAFTRGTWANISGALNLQTKGFYNMTMRWFAPNYAAGADDYVDATVISGIADRRAKVNAAYDLWPKGNGDDHISMFRAMHPDTVASSRYTSAMYVLGQNPAVTEPNQQVIRASLENLDLLVVQDIFATETANARRKAGAVTYLLPAASHVEQAGAATNSGRVLQWRYQAVTPRGNSKTDLELLLRLAKKLDDKGAFDHIKTKWTTATGSGGLGWTQASGFSASTSTSGGYTPGTFISVYDSLYGRQYGWTPNAGVAFNDATETGVNHEGSFKTGQMKGAEYVAEKIYRQQATSVANAGGGTIWIYHEGYATLPSSTRLASSYTAWGVANRAKSRSKEDPYGTYGYHKWGYAWLVNRRVFYSNNATAAVAPDASNEVPGDQTDGFQGPDRVSRIFSTLNADVMDYANNNYRKHHNMKDLPSIGNKTTPHVLAGRFPGHTEPYETPRADLATTWGYNGTTGTTANLIKTDGNSPVGAKATYPLVLTTIRCVEHFQGGPITRNNGLNVEIEPEPWIEINSVDALSRGISDGDLVNVITIRSNSTSDQLAITDYTNNPSNATDNFGKGFRARVGVGLTKDQRVGPGVVAIPWHWGDQGLSTGSRANDLCIDAYDANSIIPESKACLCQIVRIPTA